MNLEPIKFVSNFNIFSIFLNETGLGDQETGNIIFQGIFSFKRKDFGHF